MTHPSRPRLIQPSEIRGGDLLIGHTLLVTPALLLEKQLTLDEGRLLDFCTLVNALVLHDHLVTLPAKIPETLKESRLYKYLVGRDILRELDFDSSRLGQKERDEMQELLGFTFSQEEASYAMGKIRDYVYEEYVRDEREPDKISIPDRDPNPFVESTAEPERYLSGYNEYYVNTPGQEQKMNNQRAVFIDEVIKISTKHQASTDEAMFGYRSEYGRLLMRTLDFTF